MDSEIYDYEERFRLCRPRVANLTVLELGAGERVNIGLTLSTLLHLSGGYEPRRVAEIVQLAQPHPALQVSDYIDPKRGYSQYTVRNTNY